MRLGPRTLSTLDVYERSGIDRGLADRLWRALGFPDVPDEERAFSEQDLRALKVATQGFAELEEDRQEAAAQLIIDQARAISIYLTDVAEVLVAALEELQGLGLQGDAIRGALEEGFEDSEFGWLLQYVLRRRLDDVLRRQAAEAEAERAQPTLAVGFVDLVGYTSLSGDLRGASLGRLLASFESLVGDVIAESGGRVVKMIGDEAMFVVPDPFAAAAGALTIVEACERSELPGARAGAALGPLIRQAGDYFGRAVNLAARLVALAPEGGVLLDPELGAAIGDYGVELDELPSQQIKGIGAIAPLQLRSLSGDRRASR